MSARTKFIVVDEDINTRDWKDVIWALTTRVDPSREWGRPMQMTPEVTAKMDLVWQALGL